MADFDFVTGYRALQPTADRATVEARQSAFSAAAAAAENSISRVVDLAHFAYRLPFAPESDAQEWFGGIMRADDPTFSIQLDTEEAARIASLVLKSRLDGNLPGTTVLVHAAAFAGKRQTVDNHALSHASRKALQALVRRRGFSLQRPSISGGKAAAIAPLISKLEDGTAETNQTQVFQAMLGDYGAQIKQLTTSANNAVEVVFNENRRLAEEVDLLWWHLGGHSFLLDQPLDEVPEIAKPIVIGMDVGEIVNVLPGPFGVYGIIRKALGSTANTPIKLSDAVKALTSDHASLISKKPNRYPLTPVHAALSDSLISNTPVSGPQFKRNTGLSYDIRLTAYELAVQAYHERVLSKLGWI